MSLYRELVRRVGPAPANALVIFVRAVALVAVVLLSDIGFTTFTYLQLGR